MYGAPNPTEHRNECKANEEALLQCNFIDGSAEARGINMLLLDYNNSWCFSDSFYILVKIDIHLSLYIEPEELHKSISNEQVESTTNWS